MNVIKILHPRRPDGTYIIEKDGYPYHVTRNDPLWRRVSATPVPKDLPEERTPRPTPPAPMEVTRFQARMVLRDTPATDARFSSLFTQAEAWAKKAGGNTKIAWDEAVFWNRHGALVNAFATENGVTSEQLDALFAAAAAIQV